VLLARKRAALKRRHLIHVEVLAEKEAILSSAGPLPARTGT